MDTTTKWAHRIEAATLDEATNAGETWERDDVAFVMGMTGVERDEDIAYATGRSLYAIWAVQARVRRGDYDATGALIARATTPALRTCDACFTVVTPAATCLC